MKLTAANIGITYIILSVMYAVIYVGTNTMIACRKLLLIIQVVELVEVENSIHEH